MMCLYGGTYRAFYITESAILSSMRGFNEELIS